MDEKTLQTLEYQKILEQLATHTSFAISSEKAINLNPTNDIDQARLLQAQTREALHLLTTQVNLTIGGARDIRQQIDLAEHGGVLTSQDILDVKSTLISARSLVRNIERVIVECPRLFDVSQNIILPPGLIDTITRTISDHGEILDTASAQLATIRRELGITRDRLLSKLQRMVNDPKITPYLQEGLITQRDQRYVLPLRSEFKGKVKAIVHDQSSSGATLFVEPIGVVDLNNQHRELQLSERDEERRILTDLSNNIKNHAEALKQTLDTIGELDLIFARGKYANHISAIEPKLVAIPQKIFKTKEGKVTPGTTIKLFQARHPLLDPQIVVPIDVVLKSDTFAMVITGPNTGGKTVTLKTIGLLTLMAQTGMHIPVQANSEISVFENVFADIGDEQSIEQSLSTFSGHIKNIISILNNADRRSMVILDELGAGTDPQEGVALARSLLVHLLERNITTLVSTHHPELKAFAHVTPGVVNASLQFDIETLRPTYRLTIGLPGRSNALAIAQRLGMPEEIIIIARAELNPDDIQADDLLDEIHRQRDLAQESREAAEKARLLAEETYSELSTRLKEIEQERIEVLKQAREEAQIELDDIRSKAQQVRTALSKAGESLDTLKSIEAEIATIQPLLTSQLENHLTDERPEAIKTTLSIGDKVRIRSLNTKGLITALAGNDAEVQVGNLRVRAHTDDLDWISSPTKDIVQHVDTSYRRPFDTVSPGWELDLRGNRADEAVENLERYIESAYLAGLPFVRIIHGKGTGKLRLVIRQALNHHPQVLSCESGGEKEGGEGVTIVKLSSG